jgi:hypothetical protein
MAAGGNRTQGAASARGADGGRVLHRIAPRFRDEMWELSMPGLALPADPVPILHGRGNHQNGSSTSITCCP